MVMYGSLTTCELLSGDELGVVGPMLSVSACRRGRL